MNMKKLFSLVLALVLSLSLFAGCGSDSSTPPSTGGDSGSAPVENVTIQVAALHSAYLEAYPEMWQEICDAFTAQTGIKVELTVDKNLEDVLDPQMKAGNFPDVVHLAVGRPAALTETLIKENMLLELTDMLNMTIPGENVTVKDKLIPGFTDTAVTNPYSDGKTYLAPMFYGPCGLFYNKALFEEKGWEVPATWDGMWELAEAAKAEGISLFAYPTTGYFDAFTYALMNVVGGPDFFDKATHYAEGIWDTEEAKTLFEILDKLASYTEPSVPSNANNQNFLKNQQLLIDNQALFMPNGTWVTGEMADAVEAARANGNKFEWGFTALPALTEGGDAYSYTFFEQAWIPSESKHPEEAKQFLAFLYSDVAAEIFAKGNGIQPISGMTDKLEGENKLFYSIYDTGAKASMGNFAATDAVEGVSMANSMFAAVDSLVNGDITIDQYIAGIKEASDALREALK